MFLSGRGIQWPRAVLCQVILTFGQPVSQADLQVDVLPWQRHLVATTGTKLGLVDLSSDVPPGRGIWWPGAVLHQVSLTFDQPLAQADILSDVPPLEASGGQEQY